MTQTLILKDGYYKCPNCAALYHIENGDPDNWEGFCIRCKDDHNDPMLLDYQGGEMPQNP